MYEQSKKGPALTFVHCDVDSCHTGQVSVVCDIELECVDSGRRFMNAKSSHHGNLLVSMCNLNVIRTTARTTRTTHVLEF